MKTEKKRLTTFSCRITTALLLLLAVFFGNTTYAQDPVQYGTPFADVPDTRDINMYQVHIRPYSAAGNLAGVTARLDKINALGINVIYLMPIFPHGTDARSSPSPYCIKDFKAVASEYGSLADLRQLVDGAHSRGMAVILDIAINGTSWDHPWTTQHPEYYMRNGTTIQQLGNFSDIAALDLNHQGLRDAIKDAMRYWILAANIDGYRCDYANNPPLDFWSEIIGNIRGITTHKLLMLAEGDRQENFTVGFDMNFGDRWFWNALKDIAAGGPVSTRIQSINEYEYLKATGTQQACRYTGNHDTYTNDNGEVRPFVVFKNHAGVVANFLVSAYLKGVPFLMGGQEIDYEPKTDWPWTNFKFDWNQHPGAAADFANILNFRASSNAVRRGTLTIYPSDDISAFTKISGAEKVVVMANLRNASKTFVIPTGLAGVYKDAYSGAPVTLTSGAVQSFTAFQYMVLTNANSDVIPVSGVTVSPANATMGIGNTQQLTALVTPSNATNQKVSWSSSNTAVAIVGNSGLVSAIEAGTATITATTEDGNKIATAAITVNPSTSFTVNFYKPSNWGTGIKIYWWNALPTGVLADGSWPGVNMADAGNGWFRYTFTNVTSINLIFNDATNQTANLNRGQTGWYYNGTWYDTNPLTSIAVTGVTVNPTTASILVNGTQQLTATILPANASNQKVSWSSGNNAVATVNGSGLVTAVGAGTTVITVTTEDGNKTATATITVNTSISFTVNFYKPSNWGTGIKIYWWNALPAGVLANGTWPGAGMTNTGSGWFQYTFNNVTSTNLIFNDGTNQTADLSRSQTGWYYNGAWYNTKPDVSIAVTGITVSPTTASILLNGTQQLTAGILPANASNQKVSWSSSNNAVATVNGSGLVTAVGAGTAVITVTTEDGGKVASATITVTAAGTTYYQMKNRWQANTYLYDGGNGQVNYGTNPSIDDYKYQWAQIDAGSGFILLKNRASGNYMHVENQNGSIQCTATSPTWWSGMWSLPSAGDGWNYIQNRWKTTNVVNIENLLGYAQYYGTQSGWHSAMWQFVSMQASRDAIAEPDVEAVQLFPNPNMENVLSVDLSDVELNEPVTVSFKDASGETVLEYIMQESGIIHHALPAGLYFVNIRSNEINRTQKLLVQ